MNILDVGTRIKELRIGLGYSQLKLAKMLNITSSTVSRYESNLKRPSYEILILLADILDTTTDYLLGRTDI